MNKVLIIIILSLLFLNACKYKSEKGEKYVDYYKGTKEKTKLSEGWIKNNLENGKWQYYDSLGNIDETGNYDMGFKIGPWKLHSDSIDTTIDWVKRESRTRKGLWINLPKEFIVDTQNVNFDLYAYNEKKPKENFLFIIHKKPLDYTLYELNKFEKEDLDSKAKVIDYNSQLVQNDSIRFYDNYFIIEGEGDDKPWLVYNEIIESDKYILDASYKTELKYPLRKKMIFSSILLHSFCDNKHLINPFLDVSPQ